MNHLERWQHFIFKTILLDIGSVSYKHEGMCSVDDL